MYRMEKDIEEIGNGNLKIKFRLRGQDEVKALAENLDKMVQSLRVKVLEIKSAVTALEEGAKDASPEVKARIRNLKEAASKLNV